MSPKVHSGTSLFLRHVNQVWNVSGYFKHGATAEPAIRSWMRAYGS